MRGAFDRGHVGLEGIDALDGAFAVGGGFADDQSAAIILQCAGHNLRSRGTEVAGQNHQRSFVKHGWIGIGILFDFVAPIFDLDDRALFDEQARHLDGLFERAAAVMA